MAVDDLPSATGSDSTNPDANTSSTGDDPASAGTGRVCSPASGAAPSGPAERASHEAQRAKPVTPYTLPYRWTADETRARYAERIRQATDAAHRDGRVPDPAELAALAGATLSKRGHPKPIEPTLKGRPYATLRVTKKLNAKLRSATGGMIRPSTEYTNSLAMAVRKLDGGRLGFLDLVAELAATGTSEDASKYIRIYDELAQGERPYASLDQMCLVAGVQPVDLLCAVVAYAYQRNCEIANLVAAVAHPAIVHTAVESAKRQDSIIGFRDRELLLRHAGFLPVPKGQTISIGVTANAVAQAASNASADSSVPAFLQDADVLDAARTTVSEASEPSD